MMTRVLIGAVAACAVAASASASNFTISFGGTVSGTSVSSNFTGYGTIASFSGGGNGGLFNVTKTSGSNQGLYKAFCMQIGDQNFANPYKSSNLANAPEGANQAPPNPIGIGTNKARVLAALARNNFASAASASNTNLTKAFQIAIWEVVYTEMVGVSTTSDLLAWAKGLSNTTAAGGAFTGGNHVKFAAQSGAVGTALVNMLNALTESDLDYAGPNTHSAWVSMQGQDLLVVPVPAPALLAGIGLIGAVAMRRRMTKA